MGEELRAWGRSAPQQAILDARLPSTCVREAQREPTMTNTFFATALVSGHNVGVTIRAENIGTAFELAEDYLQERNPHSEVIVQAVQRINNEFTDGSKASSQVFQA
jgi:hypothetical protein